MLTIFIENFEKNFFIDTDNKIINACLHNEFKALSDPNHLEKNVIGKPRFEWDFNAIEEGFIQIVSPFMKYQSGIPNLFFHALRDLDAFKQSYIRAIIILEYTHYACLINDYYNFHEEFIKWVQDPRKCSKLTQLRYAAQYLNNYPRYLLIENVFDADTETIFYLHKWILNNYVAWGISRGVFIKWSHSLFNALTIPNYFQNSINTLCIEILYPVIMAAILSKVPNNTMHTVKKAFSYLALVTKLRCEKRAYCNTCYPEIDTYRESSLLPVTFQGFALIKSELKVDPSKYADVRFPYIKNLHNTITTQLSKEFNPKIVSEIESLEDRYFYLFYTELKKAGVFNNIAALFEKTFYE